LLATSLFDPSRHSAPWTPRCRCARRACRSLTIAGRCTRTPRLQQLSL